MGSINVILLDGSKKTLNEGDNAINLAQALSHSLAKKIIAAKVNGELRDIRDPLHDGDQVVLLGLDAPEAQEVISHSCEHMLAAAVLVLFPKAQVTMGPKDHSAGFYYDFDIGRAFTEEDIAAIEVEMELLIKQNVVFEKEYLPKEKARTLFLSLGQTYKSQILDWIPDDKVSVYKSGHFTDLCRGPHVPHSGFIKAFKLLGSSGSYWRGDSSREMLQRITGIAFTTKAELDQHINRIEEAKKRDHRKLGPKHDLFFVSERFSSFSDPDLAATEARVNINLSDVDVAKSIYANSVKIVEELLAQITQVLPSKKLNIKSINTQSRSLETTKPWIDLRMLANSIDGHAGNEVNNLVKNFNQNNDLQVKCHFEVHAHEEVGPGLVMWLPHGGRLRHIVEEFAKKRHLESGYELVYSPHIAKSDLWRISGHLNFYAESMFAPMQVDGGEYLLKPMNCPFHVLMYKFKPKSYRDLPLRLAEFGTVYRYELAGVLHGLMRARSFTQDDAHIFCRWDQLNEELDRVIAFVIAMLQAFGFTDFVVNISTRPAKSVGEDAAWERAEESLINAVKRSNLTYQIDEGGGAFYGPKIDIKLKDCLDRLWQCSTLQLDFNNPERFSLEYVNNQGEKERPVMLHRALFGSVERFIGVLIEHYAGSFPGWLAPEQVRVLTVSDRHNEHAEKLNQALVEHGLRATFGGSHDKLSAKIRQAQIDKVPLMVIVGDQEVEKNGGTLRLRSQEDKGFLPMDELIKAILDHCQIPS
jgi:threonyl-tRNA synthetase